MSQEYTDAILKAIRAVVENSLAKHPNDLTISGVITSVVDLNTGEYRLLYNGDDITVFARSINEVYRLGDNVQVLIPQGDFSYEYKLIIGKTPKTVNTKTTTNQDTTIFDVSSNLVSFTDTNAIYYYDTDEKQGLVAGDHETKELASWDINSSRHKTFQQYAKKYDHIKLSGEFFTLFQSTHYKGNYGIIVEFYTKDSVSDEHDNNISYQLDLNSFNGDPYRLSTPSPQTLIIPIQKNYFTGIASISMFETGFDYDRYVDNNGQETSELNTEDPNIYVQNIGVSFVDTEVISSDTYYLTLDTPLGIFFTDYVSTITMTGKLFYQGSDIYNANSCECQWYISDPSIKRDSEFYNKQAGIGWMPIEETSNKLTLTVDTDIWYSKKYKLVLIYNSRNVFTIEQEIINLRSPYKDIHIAQITDKDLVYLKLESQEYYGEWYISYPDGKYLKLTNGKTSSPIEISSYLTYPSATIYCTAYVKSGDEYNYIASLYHEITNTDSQLEVTVDFDGDDMYQYDANGDITIEDSEIERFMEPVISWKDGSYNKGATMAWHDPFGTIITADGISYDANNNTMFQDIRVDEKNNLWYHVKSKYKNYYSNNTLTVTIDFAGGSYSFEKEFLFFKDGDQGTNGTSFVCAIRPCDINGNKISDFTPLEHNTATGEWKDINLKCFVYKDGEDITTLTGYTTTFEWKACSYLTLDVSDTQQIRVSAIEKTSGTGLELKPRYIKVKATIRDTETRKNIIVYNVYPIDIAVGDTTMVARNFKLDIPQTIKYTSSGYSPMYQNYAISAIYGEEECSISPLNDLVTIDNGYLRPAINFDFEENSIGLVGIYSTSSYVLHSIVMFLNTFGNEAINGWDGTLMQNAEDGYILAPQIGAGTKNFQSNLFTGVVMGKDTSQDKTGIYGYRDGVNTFGLRDDGIAYFGRKNYGRIIINPNYSVIYGGACEPNSFNGAPSAQANGMYIRLSKRETDPSSTVAIQVGSPSEGNSFQVTYEGKLTCQGANIQGTITAEKGYIGDPYGNYWKLEAGVIQSRDGSVQIVSPREGTDYVIKAGDNFKVAANGKITAKLGEIGGWKIASNRIYSSSGKTRLESSGTIYTDYFIITDDGTSTAGILGLSSRASITEALTLYTVSKPIVVHSAKDTARLSAGDSDTAADVIVQSFSGNTVLAYGTSGEAGYMSLTLNSSGLSCNVPSDKQSGIYAQFA